MLSKWCCMLTVVCLPVILLSLDADAQPTVDDETMTCGSAVSDEAVSMFKSSGFQTGVRGWVPTGSARGFRKVVIACTFFKQFTTHMFSNLHT